MELLKGRYCLFCILDAVKDSASALWKAVVIGSEMMGLSKYGVRLTTTLNLVVGRSGKSTKYIYIYIYMGLMILTIVTVQE